MRKLLLLIQRGMGWGKFFCGSSRQIRFAARKTFKISLKAFNNFFPTDGSVQLAGRTLSFLGSVSPTATARKGHPRKLRVLVVAGATTAKKALTRIGKKQSSSHNNKTVLQNHFLHKTCIILLE